jgi:hypothetical protein
MRRRLVGLLLLAAPVAADDVDAAVRILSRAESFDGKYTGEGGDISPTYRAYERLGKAASLERLLKLTDHPSPIVRCYAVEAIVEHHPLDALDGIIAKHVDDTAKVLAFFGGCCGETTDAGSIMIEVAMERLTPARRAAIRKRLLEGNPERPILDRALRDETFEPELRDRVRQIATGGNRCALIALARYRNEADVPLLLAALTREGARPGDLWIAHTAAAEFPHPRLRPAVVAAAREARTSAWCRAVAAYEDAAAATLVEAAWREGAEPYDVFEGVRDRRCDAFLSLFVRLWLEARQLDEGVLAFLFARDPKGTLDRIEGQIQEHIDRAPFDQVDAMLDLLGRERPDRLEPSIVAALRGTDHLPDALLHKAAALKRDAFIEPLFRVFESGALHYSPRYCAAKAILCYGRADLDRRLQEALDKATGIRDGEPKERLVRLLREKPRVWTDDD